MEEPTAKPSRRKLAAGIGLALLIILLVASVSYYQLVLVPAQVSQPASTPTPTPTLTPTPTATLPSPTPSPTAPPAGTVVKIEIELVDTETPWGFSVEGELNPEIRVHAGDTVEITLINTGQTVHDITIPQFGITAEDTFVAPGETIVVSFVADSKGTFEYICSQPGHEQLGMKGIIVVE